MEKTHWKKHFNSDYTGSHDFKQGEEREVVIKSVSDNEMYNAQTNQKEIKFCINFEGDNKPIVANKTNCRVIASFYGDFTEDWIGKKITLCVKKVKVGREMVDAIRVKEVKPSNVNIQEVSKKLNEIKSQSDLSKYYGSFSTMEQAQVKELFTKRKSEL